MMFSACDRSVWHNVTLMFSACDGGVCDDVTWEEAMEVDMEVDGQMLGDVWIHFLLTLPIEQ